MNIATLYAKYCNGEKNGYLTDDELLCLIIYAEQARDLATALGAGNACELYFINLVYSLSHIKFARRLP